MKYQVIDINTVWNQDPRLGGLSFVEGERDIPFAIKRIYCIYKAEENQLKCFYAQVKNCKFLFCPYGAIDITLKDDQETENIVLDKPSKGLVLNAGIQWEISWREQKSVLCVATSEDHNEHIRNDEKYLLHKKEGAEKKEIHRGKAGNVFDVNMLEFPCAFFTVEPSDTKRLPHSIVIEGTQNVPFEIKRIFYIFGEGNIGAIRGKHANRKSEFVLFNIVGKSKVKVIDEDLSETVYELNEAKDAVYLPRMIWKEMYDFTPDAVLMVVTNEYYDSSEYVRDFDTFAEDIREEKKNWQIEKI